MRVQHGRPHHPQDPSLDSSYCRCPNDFKGVYAMRRSAVRQRQQSLQIRRELSSCSRREAASQMLLGVRLVRLVSAAKLHKCF